VAVRRLAGRRLCLQRPGFLRRTFCAALLRIGTDAVNAIPTIPIRPPVSTPGTQLCLFLMIVDLLRYFPRWHGRRDARAACRTCAVVVQAWGVQARAHRTPQHADLLL
jgi:hypothetical protein